MGDSVLEALWTRHHAREREWASALNASERRTLSRLLRKLIDHHPRDAERPRAPRQPRRELRRAVSYVDETELGTTTLAELAAGARPVATA